MSRWLNRAFWPVRHLENSLWRPLKRKIVALIQVALEPTQAEFRTLNERVDRELPILHAKIDRIVDINVAAEVLRDLHIHNNTLRAILADCELIREMDPMFNSFLRDLMRLQMQTDELVWCLEQRAPWVVHPAAGADSQSEAA
jgi:hypothetical protein